MTQNTSPSAPTAESVVTARAVFADAVHDLPLTLPETWNQPPKSRLVRTVVSALQPEQPLGSEPRWAPPAPAFWPVYARQRGLRSADPLWARQLPVPALRGRGTISFATTLEGAIGGFDAQLIACTCRRGRRSTSAHLIMALDGIEVPNGMAGETRHDPSGPGAVGWVLKGGTLATWLDVVPLSVRGGRREGQTSRPRPRLVPLVDEQLVDWFCVASAQVFDRFVEPVAVDESAVA